MSLKNTLQHAIQKGIAKFDDVRVYVVYHNITGTTYTPGSDSATTVETVVNFRGIEARITEAESNIAPADKIVKKLIVAYLDLPLVPSLKDWCTTSTVAYGSGKRWNVVERRDDPARAVHVLYLQEP